MRRSPRRLGAALAAVAVIAATGVVHSDRAGAAPTPRQLTPPQTIGTSASPPTSPEYRSNHRHSMRDGDYVVEYVGQPLYWPGWGDGINEGSAYGYVYGVREGTWGDAGMQYALADSYSGLVGNGFDVPHAMLHKPYWLGDGPAPFWSSWINSRPYVGYPTMNLHYPAPREIVIVNPAQPNLTTQPNADPETGTPGTATQPGPAAQPGTAQQFTGPGAVTQPNAGQQGFRTTPQGSSGTVAYGNCDAARAAGAAPVYRGSPGYGPHLDADNDGVGCE